VTFDPGFEEYRVSVGVGMRIYIPALGPVPLALDFGFPVIDQSGDQRRLFSFSFDLPIQ
jgi:outer membrane protein insertion porin family